MILNHIWFASIFKLIFFSYQCNRKRCTDSAIEGIYVYMYIKAAGTGTCLFKVYFIYMYMYISLNRKGYTFFNIFTPYIHEPCVPLLIPSHSVMSNTPQETERQIPRIT